MPTIIAATDGSPSARAAVDWAVADAVASHARLELVGAWSVLVNGELGASTLMSEEVLYADRDAMAAILAEAKAAAGEAGVDADTCLVEGDAAAEICRLAKERNASLIVMGSRGHKPLAAALLGSVAARVLQHAACPVMVVPDAERRP
jgi:nucleotide-binding universal stress UspA family protein